MCLKESFFPFSRDALNFRPPKIYAAPPSSVHVSLSLSRHHCADAPFNSTLYDSVTAHAHRKSRVRSRNDYVTLVYLSLFAVVLRYS